jgi:hypothetical protein
MKKPSKRVIVGIAAAAGVTLLGCCVIFGLLSPVTDRDSATMTEISPTVVLATEIPKTTSISVPTAAVVPTDTPILPTPIETPVATDTPVPPTLVPTAAPANTDTPEPTPLPTATPEPTPPPSPAGAQVIILTVDKGSEFVDIQNVGGQAQDLAGWHLLSEKGNQDCPLGGVIQPGDVLRIWAKASDAGQGGFNCGFGSNIWNNSESDPAVLYDATGREVDRK